MRDLIWPNMCVWCGCSDESKGPTFVSLKGRTWLHHICDQSVQIQNRRTSDSTLGVYNNCCCSCGCEHSAVVYSSVCCRTDLCTCFDQRRVLGTVQPNLVLCCPFSEIVLVLGPWTRPGLRTILASLCEFGGAAGYLAMLPYLCCESSQICQSILVPAYVWSVAQHEILYGALASHPPLLRV